MEADLRIVVGNVEPHQFQGFSVEPRARRLGWRAVTINANHAMLRDPQAQPCRYDDNTEAPGCRRNRGAGGIHFALNGILTATKALTQGSREARAR
jgi:hypothetical protein